MDNKIKNIIFDFDGTLADTLEVILETMRLLTKEFGLPELTDEECKSVIGIKLEEAPKALWGDKAMSEEEFVDVYRRIFYGIKDKMEIRCFPNVKETLQNLKNAGIKMAIASSRSRLSLDEYLERLGIRGYFDCIVGGDEVNEGKPSPETVNVILKKMHWNPEETMTVGDMGVDILMGKGANTKTCGVTYGNGTTKELSAAGADKIIDDFQNLLS